MARKEDRNFDDLAAFTRTAAAQDVIFSSGDDGADLFVVQEGRVELVDEGAGQLAVIEEGGVFGEWSTFEEQPRDVTARALSAVRLIALDRAALTRVIDEAPEIAAFLLNKLARAVHDRTARAVREAAVSAAAIRAAEAVRSAPPAAPTRPPSGDPELIEALTGKKFTLSADESHVGRIDRSTGFTPQVDLTPHDTERTLSRKHARILRRGSTFVVREETSSRNGTFVNGQRISAGADVELRDGDEVRFGLVKTTFRWR
jgi:hypothetical protein